MNLYPSSSLIIPFLNDERGIHYISLILRIKKAFGRVGVVGFFSAVPIPLHGRGTGFFGCFFGFAHNFSAKFY